MTLSRASCRTTGWPTTRRPASTATASAIAVHLAGIRLDRIDDLGVARAAAQVTLERGPDVVPGRTRITREERQGREQHARRAEPALDRPVAQERLLERMEMTVGVQTAQI